MNAGTIFVVCLAAGFLLFVLYLARLSRRTQRQEELTKEVAGRSDSDNFPSQRAS